jgi:hypothetical protein
MCSDPYQWALPQPHTIGSIRNTLATSAILEVPGMKKTSELVSALHPADKDAEEARFPFFLTGLEQQRANKHSTIFNPKSTL